MNKNFKNMAIGAVAATVAGAYYLYGSREGKAVRKNMSSFAVKMKGEMLAGLEKLKEVSEPKYKDLLKKVEVKYKKAANTPEVKKVVGEIGAVWNKMKKEVNAEIVRRAEQIKKEEAKTKGKIKSAIKKVTKKVSKKKEVAIPETTTTGISVSNSATN
jgi:exosome complex RNA-binding protein Rrp4